MNHADSFVIKIFDAINAVTGVRSVGLHEPVFSGNEWKYLKSCLDSTFVSSVGQYVDRFELDLANFTGAKSAVAVVNGTAALHVALLLAGVEENDEVLMPSLTFVATANAVSYCKAVPHFIESEENFLGIDIDALKNYLHLNCDIKNGLTINKNTGRVIRALIVMHTFGHPGKLDDIANLAELYNIKLIEDAAESIGSYCHGKHTGTFGFAGTLSFNGNKTITTGGGGAILFNDSDLAHRAKHLTTTAKVNHRWSYDHDKVGYNYRMPNINAALGCAQLEQLPEFLIKKRQLYSLYESKFQSIDGVRLISEPPWAKSNYWLQAILLDKKRAHLRDNILEVTNDSGITTRPLWRLMHKLNPYRGCPKMNLSSAESIESRLINIPSGVGILV